MAGYEPEEPEFSDDSEYCQAVRIGRHDKGPNSQSSIRRMKVSRD